ncbi:hypothetical protein [Sporosarcina sp. Te-1]|uniref:hypothetical protein n=1 Tax=Sporosarcina sp. Te-1 TaxID=2818390 RepID=UPI001A9F0405|nr:hypothetical protein [Sporosarcina sp. Te-1]QTD40954.1 hypothetical protein J3U78_19795 [Sporosarcina sp. Te-1]
MKRLLSIGGVLCVSLLLVPTLVHGEEIGEAKEKVKSPRLVSGLLEGVGKTVDDTVQSVGSLVETTVGTVDQTVQDTATFASKTVESIKQPQDKPASSLLERTGELIGKTTDNVTPVVESTTDTVNKTVANVNATVEELPDVPIVTPVVTTAGRTVVEETVESAGDVVTATVSAVDQTVKDTINFSSTTVETVSTPQSDKPVVDLLNGVGSLVDSTVSNVTPVVESTTGTVQTTVSGVNETVGQLPDVPVVKPIVMELGNTVEETVISADEVVFSTVEAVNQTIQDTVTLTSNTVEGLSDPKARPLTDLKPNTEDFLQSTLTNVGSILGQTTNTLQTVLTGSSGVVEELPVIPVDKPDGSESGNAPTVSSNLDAQASQSGDVEQQASDIPVSKPSSSQEGWGIKELVEQNAIVEIPQTAVIDNQPIDSSQAPVQISFDSEEKHHHATDVGPADEPATADRTDGSQFEGEVLDSLSADQMAESERKHTYPETPLHDDGILNIESIIVTGSGSSITSPMTFTGGGSDVVPGILTRIALMELMYQRHWLLADIEMNSQWDHAPPGQPPAIFPFLLIK